MDDQYIIALSDAGGACHLLTTDVSSQEEVQRLDALMRRWTPMPSKMCFGRASFTAEDILGSLRKITGHTFSPLVANYLCSYQGQQIELPSIGGKNK